MQNRREVIGRFYPIPPGAKALGVAHKVRVTKLDKGLSTKLGLLLPTNQAVPAIVKNQRHKRDSEPDRSPQLLRVHQEAPIPGGRYDLAAGKEKLGRHRPRHSESHGGKAVRDDARIGLLAGV